MPKHEILIFIISWFTWSPWFSWFGMMLIIPIIRMNAWFPCFCMICNDSNDSIIFIIFMEITPKRRKLKISIFPMEYYRFRRQISRKSAISMNSTLSSSKVHFSLKYNFPPKVVFSKYCVLLASNVFFSTKILRAEQRFPAFREKDRTLTYFWQNLTF